MPIFKPQLLLLALAMWGSASLMAQGIPKVEYKAAQQTIGSDYQAASTKCDALTGNAKDVCGAEAKSTRDVAKADLEAKYKPTDKNHYKARVAKAEGDYRVAKERCDDKAGNDKDVCVKEAKALQVTAKADAKLQMKTTDANKEAKEVGKDARKDAAEDKSTAAFVLAKEKCDALAGAAKDTCVNAAKAKYGK